MAALSLTRSKSYLGAYFRRMKGRLGTPKAITATAHKLARIIDALVRYGVAYQKKSEDDYEAQHRQRMEKNLHRRAQELGDELKKIEAPPTETTPSPA